MSGKKVEFSPANAPISTELAPQISDPALTVACMGVTACRRVCEFVNPGVQPGEADPAFALPLERACDVLESLGSVDHLVAKELLDAAAMPKLDVFNSENAATEAKDYLDHLEAEREAFGAYLDMLLVGTSLPRFTQEDSRQAYEKSRIQYKSKNTAAESTKDELIELNNYYTLLRGFFDKNSLENTGLLFDKNIVSTLEKTAREIGVGHHIKLVGEPGIAKTTLAKYLALRNARAHHPDAADADIQPVIISFSSTSEAESHVREQTFEENTLGERLGKLADAMERGVGVVLDEQNGMTADQQTFFNDFLLKKPGQPVTVAGKTFTIQKGFCVIATLNPMTDTQGNRRHGRQQQDSANAARFTRIDLKYPYQNANDKRKSGDETISRLFFARYVDSFGWKLPTQKMLDLLDNTAQLVRELTKKATEPTKDGTSTTLTATQARPDLAECITPRDLDRLLTVSFGYGTPDEIIKATRLAIREKTEQILNSDNGHFVSPTTKTAVEALLTTGNF